MNQPENQDFFSKLWKCPIRRCWRYGRKFVFVFILGIITWMSLDYFAIVLMKPQGYLPFLPLVIHAFLTIIFSLILTLTTQQIYLRMNSRFRLIRAFQPIRSSSRD